ncbi:MAG: F0F1 ATP synthase subunit A [Chryseolinea sp.]
MELSPDETVFWQYDFITINLTIVTTWALMLVLIVSSRLVTRKLKTDNTISAWQCVLEIVVMGINEQIKDIGLRNPEQYIGFIGTLFLFIAMANLCIIFPGYSPPTASLSTTTALALCVFIAVPFFGISKSGLGGYLKSYLKPTFIMLPFNLISEVTRTLALAVRLFGNIMSGGMIVAILLSISPFIFPVVMNALGLLTGMVQAYIFSILATVYITAAVHDSKSNNIKSSTTKYIP